MRFPAVNAESERQRASPLFPGPSPPRSARKKGARFGSWFRGLLLNIAYLFALAMVSPVVIYRAIRHGRYRRGIGQKMLGLSATDARALIGDLPTDPIWIHAVSVGEVSLLPGLVDALSRAEPDASFVISTSTDTGYDLALKRFDPDRVFFCPLDFSWAVNRTLRLLRPRMLVLAELELWPNLIAAADRVGCPVVVINARLSQRSGQRYAKLARFTRSTFARLSAVGCQDQACRDRFAACGVPDDRLVVTGSLKFDNAPQRRDVPAVETLVEWCGIDPWLRVWVVGSTQPGEEAMALSVYGRLRETFPNLRLILVPRHRERFDAVAAEVAAAGLTVHRRSDGQPMHRSESAGWPGNIVVMFDTIGELRDVWGLAQIATVGGSFGDRGGQNMIEPAGYGAAVSFGPDTRNFSAIAEGLIAADGAVRVADEAELESFVRRCTDDLPAADALARAATAWVQTHRGATEKTVELLFGNSSKFTMGI